MFVRCLGNPGQFNSQLVAFRARILIAFEDFEVYIPDCAQKSIDAIWLEYGRGPKNQPTIWCCGDLRSKDQLRVKMNRDFASFDHHLKARKHDQRSIQ